MLGIRVSNNNGKVPDVELTEALGAFMLATAGISTKTPVLLTEVEAGRTFTAKYKGRLWRGTYVYGTSARSGDPFPFRLHFDYIRRLDEETSHDLPPAHNIGSRVVFSREYLDRLGDFGALQGMLEHRGTITNTGRRGANVQWDQGGSGIYSWNDLEDLLDEVVDLMPSDSTGYW